MTSAVSNTPASPLWQRIGAHAHHGVALPLSALHSKNSSGIGEFFDLIPLIDWCCTLNMDVIQLLPLNDSGNDPSPYNVLSSCALNPVFLSLAELPQLNAHAELQKDLEPLRALNSSPHVQYRDVKTQKMRWLRSYFEKTKKEIVSSQAFSQFVTEQSWIQPYALFKTLRELNEEHCWWDWPSPLQTPTQAEYRHLLNTHAEDILFYTALQYLCFLQLKAVKAYATQKKVFLMGDIPFLISRNSADVWHERRLFDLDLSAGAPPDVYNQEGQYWGLPLYRWEAIEKEDNLLWKTRLKFAEHFFDLYRIDHVLGFFRIWGIPLNAPSKEGECIPSDSSKWIPDGRKRLTMLMNMSHMLPIAEDLGAVSTEIRLCLHQLGICGLKVIRWERSWDKDNQFIPYKDYTPLSLSCVSTHDSQTLGEWWELAPEEAQAFALFKGWNYEPKLETAQRKDILLDCHHTPSLFHINLLQEYLALFPELVSSDPSEERINIPGTVLPRNWVYRFRLPLEQITSHPGLKRAIQDILQ